MKVYGITTCGSVKKATSFLRAKGIEFDFIDFKKTKISNEQIVSWINKQPLKVLFNTKGTKFKTLELSKELSDNEKIAWLEKEPLLFKRPVIEFDNGALIVGFDENVYEEVLK